MSGHGKHHLPPYTSPKCFSQASQTSFPSAENVCMKRSAGGAAVSNLSMTLKLSNERLIKKMAYFTRAILPSISLYPPNMNSFTPICCWTSSMNLLAAAANSRFAFLIMISLSSPKLLAHINLLLLHQMRNSAAVPLIDQIQILLPRVLIQLIAYFSPGFWVEWKVIEVPFRWCPRAACQSLGPFDYLLWHLLPHDIPQGPLLEML